MNFIIAWINSKFLVKRIAQGYRNTRERQLQQRNNKTAASGLGCFWVLIFIEIKTDLKGGEKCFLFDWALLVEMTATPCKNRAWGTQLVRVGTVYLNIGILS